MFLSTRYSLPRPFPLASPLAKTSRTLRNVKMIPSSRRTTMRWTMRSKTCNLSPHRWVQARVSNLPPEIKRAARFFPPSAFQGLTFSVSLSASTSRQCQSGPDLNAPFFPSSGFCSLQTERCHCRRIDHSRNEQAGVLLIICNCLSRS